MLQGGYVTGCAAAAAAVAVDDVAAAVAVDDVTAAVMIVLMLLIVDFVVM